MAARPIRLCQPVLIAGALAIAAFAQSSAQDQGKEKKPAKAEAKAAPTAAAQSTRPSDPKLYAGSETCASCHDEIAQIHEKGPHAKTQLISKGSPAFQGCEGCHGPGKEHADAGGDPGKIISLKSLGKSQSTQICLGCHAQGEEHAKAKGPQQAKSDVGCLDCHSVHRAQKQKGLLKKTAERQGGVGDQQPGPAAGRLWPVSHSFLGQQS